MPMTYLTSKMDVLNARDDGPSGVPYGLSPRVIGLQNDMLVVEKFTGAD